MSTVTIPTGYSSDLTFYATRYQQGGRTVYSLDLSLVQIAELLPAPNPSSPTEGNRQVKESHARAFAEYIRENPTWVAPALVLRAPDIFTFEVQQEIAGTQFGVISFPKMASTDLRILDGQHRTLGIHLAIQGIASDLEKARSVLSSAKKAGAAPDAMQESQAAVDLLLDQRNRLSLDRTSLQIFIEDDQMAYKQMFFDIAENALGITSSVKARFDSRKAVNRALDGVTKHALFRDRVDLEQDRMVRGNQNLVGAKHVAEIIRTLAVGLEGRIGRRVEDELDEGELVEKTNNFLDALVSGFPQLAKIADDELTPPDLRATNMLGSTVMLRILAGVYAELIERQGLDDDDIVDFFDKLAPAMSGPVKSDSIWIQHVPNSVFTVGSLSPRSRRQDLKTLRDALVEWADTKPSWLY